MTKKYEEFIDGEIPVSDENGEYQASIKILHNFFTTEGKQLEDALLDGISDHEQAKTYGLTTWVDCKESWDGHALAIYNGLGQTAGFMYFHVDRRNSEIIEKSSYLFCKSGQTEISQLEELLSENNDRIYRIRCMISKVARMGTALSDGIDGPTIKALFEQNLTYLAKYFPKQRNENSDQNSSFEMINDLFRAPLIKKAIEERLALQGVDICTVRSIFKDNIYVMNFDSNEEGQLLIRSNNPHKSDEFFCSGVDEEKSLEHVELEKLLKTIEKGKMIDYSIMESYIKEVYDEY